MTQTTDELLAERGKTHGEYADHAAVTQAIMDVCTGATNWRRLPATIRETLHMTAHKIGRVLTGNPFLRDHYDDICGYNRLISQRINAAQDGMVPWPPEPTAQEAVTALLKGVGATVVLAEPRAEAAPSDTDEGYAHSFMDASTGRSHYGCTLHDLEERTALADDIGQHTLGTEELTFERVSAALRHGFNCAGVDAAVSLPDIALASMVAYYMPKYPRGTLVRAGDFKADVVSACQMVPALKQYGKEALRANLLPPVLAWLRGNSGPQVVSRLEEHDGPSAYSAAYDQLAADFGMPRSEMKARFLRLAYHHAGPMGFDRDHKAAEGWPTEESERAVDVLYRELMLNESERVFLDRNINGRYDGLDALALSRALGHVVASKNLGTYHGNVGKFAAHVFLLARLIAQREELQRTVPGRAL